MSTFHRLSRPLLAGLLASACSRGGDPPPRPAPAKAQSVPADAAVPRFQPMAPVPSGARRPSPPPTLAAAALTVGAQAPAVALTDATGAPWTLAAALATTPRVMLVFYRGDWCPFCRQQLGELQRNLDQLARRRVTVVAISVDPVAVNRHLADTLGLTFTVLADPTRAATRAFGVEDAENEIAWPAIFVVDRDGTVAWRWLADGYRERIATPEVARALDALPLP